MPVFRGSTERGQELPPDNQAPPPFVNAGWWKVGQEVTGVVVNTDKNANGAFFELRLAKPETLQVGQVKARVVRISFYTGIWLALRAIREAAGDKKLRIQIGDQLWIKCTGITPPKEPGHSPSPNFEIEIDRPDNEQIGEPEPQPVTAASGGKEKKAK